MAVSGNEKWRREIIPASAPQAITDRRSGGRKLRNIFPYADSAAPSQYNSADSRLPPPPFFSVFFLPIDQRIMHPQKTSFLAILLTNLFASVLVNGNTISAEIGTSDGILRVDSEGFQKHAAGFFKTYCVDCHSGQSPEGEFAIDKGLGEKGLGEKGLGPDFANRSVAGRWREVINVLNSHEMPPATEPQPTPEAVAGLIDWATGEMIRVELHQRKQHVTLRRLNRNEYRNTIRDLVGIDFDTSHFPEDASASGFDNIGHALGSSPLQVELYLSAAETITHQMFFVGDQPEAIHWRFEPETGDSDSNRVRYGQHNVIVNGGKNRVDSDGRVMHHDSWDRKINARDFRLPTEATYKIRVRAASRIPSRDQVVDYAIKAIGEKRDQELEKNPQRRDSIERNFNNQIEHYKTSRHYDYGPGRLKIVTHLGGQPSTVAEFDVDSLDITNEGNERRRDLPKVFEFPVRMTTESAGITLQYAYQVPRELENFTLQGKDDFPRPEVWVDWFEIEGPIYPSWPPPSHSRWLPNELPTDAIKRHELAMGVLKKFLPRAFRRQVSENEVASFMKLYDAAVAFYPDQSNKPDTFIESLKVPLATALVSPHFLFLAEPAGTDPQGTATSPTLSNFEIATRLSYFLWSSMPDDQLFQVAASENLSDHAVRLQQVDRMLIDPKAENFTENFASQWLGIREVGSNPPVDDLFRDYDSHVEESIVRQTLAYFRDVLQNDRDILTLIQSDHEVLNERLSRFYELPKVEGDHFRRVKLDPDATRGGLLTHASILTVTSNGTRTSPVKRGTWILKTLLASDPGLPVANVGEIAPKVPGIDKATVRDRLEIHRELPQCARCHHKIDPLGFALENYDAAGRWRLREGFGYQGRIGDNDPLIDSSAVMPDGKPINGVAGLRQAILERKTMFLTSIAEKLYTYALGREVGYADEAKIRHAVAKLDSNPSQRTLRNLIHQIVTSESFEMR